ncbi:flagellar biosynthetic protein FliO [Paenibacillus turpanensis]|uniref:flagellar biosynthetic protein FliO n=1 Tax=Paenibacillus turpanensis TaxID=2689078 RepID=UPI00140CA555|nr:flagellar biosynthetic protein FliO [Paenibacillus turpanensis]
MRKYIAAFLLSLSVGLYHAVSVFAAGISGETGEAGEQGTGLGTPLQGGTEAPNFDSPSIAGSIIQVILVLIVMVGLIVLLIKVLANKNRSFQSHRAIRQLGGVGLGPNKSLQVVEIGKSVYLIGVGDEIRLVDKISDPEEAGYIIDSLQQEGTMKPNEWIHSLSGLVKRRFGKDQRTSLENQVVSEELPDSEFQQLFQERLKGLTGRKQMLEDMLNEQYKEERKNEK